MFYAGVLFLRYTATTADITTQKRIAEAIRDLKANGEKIIVDLTQCELKGNNYTEEREKYGDQNDLLTVGFELEIQAWNSLGGDSMRNVEQVEVAQTIIIFSRLNNRNGLTEKFISRVIYKDEITLSFYLDRQKKTTLYVDKVNRKKYYFDLSFLD